MRRAVNFTQSEGSGKGASKMEVRKNALAMRDNIIANERVATKFFFEEMRPKMASLADSYNRSYSLDLLTDDICHVTYLSCWENGWAKLKAFKGNTTIHGWVARIASQATYKFLMEDKYIDGNIGHKKRDSYLSIHETENEEIRQEKFQVWHDRSDEDEEKDVKETLRCILSNLYHCEDWDANVKSLTSDLISSLSWEESMKELWQQKFFHDVPSKELAEHFNVRNTWIDNRYCKLNKQFRDSASKWWNKYTG